MFARENKESEYEYLSQTNPYRKRCRQSIEMSAPFVLSIVTLIASVP